MSTSFCQGLQLCLEPRVKETATLSLKLATPRAIELGSKNASLFNNHNDHVTNEITEKYDNDNIPKQKISNLDVGCWSFLQSLSSYSKSSENATNFESACVKPCPPLSLEFCTESLGSETGSDTSESNIFPFSSLEPITCEKVTAEGKQSIGQFSTIKKANSRGFPPPLTSIRGLTSFQIRPHREGGRLIIKAVEAPPNRACFEAERSHGCLKLRFTRQKETLEEACEDDKTDPFENEQNEKDNQEDDEENSPNIMKKYMDGNRILMVR